MQLDQAKLDKVLDGLERAAARVEALCTRADDQPRDPDGKFASGGGGGGGGDKPRSPAMQLLHEDLDFAKGHLAGLHPNAPAHHREHAQGLVKKAEAALAKHAEIESRKGKPAGKPRAGGKPPYERAAEPRDEFGWRQLLWSKPPTRKAASGRTEVQTSLVNGKPVWKSMDVVEGWAGWKRIGSFS